MTTTAERPATPADAYLNLSRRGRSTAGAYVLGLLVILGCWFVAGSVLSLIAVIALVGPENLPALMGGGGNLAGDPFALYVALNLSFWPLVAGIWIAVTALLQRPFLTLITPARSVSWGRIGLGLAVYTGLAALAAVIEALLYPGRYQFVLNLERYLPFVLAVLVLTPIQTTAEELLFRGYLVQGFGGLTRNPVVLGLVSGVLFMLPHLGNPEVAVNPGLLATYYLVFGLVLVLVTLRSGSLELAIGAHAGNNLFAALIANYANSALTTESIFLVTVLDPAYGLLSGLAIGLLFYWLLFRTPLRATAVAVPEPEPAATPLPADARP